MATKEYRRIRINVRLGGNDILLAGNAVEVVSTIVDCVELMCQGSARISRSGHFFCRLRPLSGFGTGVRGFQADITG